MNAERRPGEGAASEVIAATTTKVHRIGPACGCLHGREAHECGLELPVRPPACPGRCQTFGVAELRYFGERHGCCPCLLPGRVA